MPLSPEPTVPPVLLIAWRRPDTTREVLEAVRSARPSHLFVAVDGPDDTARPGESDAVAATIEAIESGIDWPCRVERRYSRTNLGCRRGVSEAIDWFFSQVDEGIILEDDCVPHPDFFPYCGELLERFRDEPRVLCISGDNSAGVMPRRGRSYAFVRYPQIWGWATWRRAWQLYDRDLHRYRSARDGTEWRRLVPHAFERQVTADRLDRLLATGEPDTWDYQWMATVILHRGLSIHPSANLVSNVGFGESATHTSADDNPRAAAPTHAILPLAHPSRIRLDRATSHELFLRTQMSEAKRRANSPLRRALKRLRRRLRRLRRPRRP